MFESLREALDSLAGKTGKKYLLTTAVGGFGKFVEHTEMDRAQQYLDFVNLMTYDYYPDTVAVHHTNLYPSDNIPLLKVPMRHSRHSYKPASRLKNW